MRSAASAILRPYLTDLRTLSSLAWRTCASLAARRWLGQLAQILEASWLYTPVYQVALV